MVSPGLNTDQMMVRVSASFLAIHSHVVDVDDEQLAALARQFLVPMLEP